MTDSAVSNDARPSRPLSDDAPGAKPGGRLLVPLAAVALVALGTSLIMAFVISSGGSSVDGGFDPYYFGEMGKSIANGHGFEGFGSLITRRAPLYPIVIGGVYFVFGEHVRLVLLLHCLAFAGTAVLAWDLGRRHFNQRTGVIAGILCAFNPLLLRYIPSLHLESVLTFLVTLLIWCTYRFYRNSSALNGVFIGVVAGLATLTKAVVLLYPVIFLVALFLVRRAARRRGEAAGDPTPWRAIGALVLAMGLTILPWTVRNHGTTGHVVLVSSGTSDAFLRGLIFSRTEFVTLQEPPYEVAENESNEYFRSLARAAGTVWERDDYETDQILNREAKRVLLHEPAEVARKSAVGVFSFWYQMTSAKTSLVVLASAIVTWALAIVGWRRARRTGLAVWPFLLPVFYLNLVLALLLALGRYSAPILPSLLVVSAFGVDSLLERWGRRRA